MSLVSPIKTAASSQLVNGDLLCDANPRLLVVDDNPAIHNDIRKTLASSNANPALDEVEAAMFGRPSKVANANQYEIDDAYQGHEALCKVAEACARGKEYDVAIIDMRMPPGWDGVETVEQLWKVDPDLQVIICTAFSDYSWDEVSARLGVSDKLLILKKPFDECEMSQAVRALSVKRKLLMQARYNLATLQGLVEQRTQELRTAHEESDRLLSAIYSALVAFDATGIVTRWNAVAEELFGLKAEEAVGRELIGLPIPWTEKAHFRAFIETNRTGENSHLEAALDNRGQGTCVIDLTLHPVIVNGSHEGGLMLASDITDRKLLEQQLQQSQKLESVGQLAAGVAHEINTPMQYVGDNLQFVQSALQKLQPALMQLNLLVSPESQAAQGSEVTLESIRSSLGKVNLKRLLEHMPKAVQDANQGVQNVARIVRAMKEFSHPGSDNPVPLDVNRILESTVVVSRSEWKYVAELETNLANDIPSILGSAHELQQVFLNLLVNAAHAIETRQQHADGFKGKISVTSQRLENRCLIRIHDNGCGIPREIRNRVYDPFFTTKGVGKGTGQGLAIAHQIIAQKHAGKLWFESEPNVGTTFYIELPIESSPALLP